MSRSPYRLPAEPVDLPPPTIQRSGQWNNGRLYVKWDVGSGYVEVGVHNGTGAALQFARVATDAAREFFRALDTAIMEASTGDAGSMGRTK